MQKSTRGCTITPLLCTKTVFFAVVSPQNGATGHAHSVLKFRIFCSFYLQVRQFSRIFANHMACATKHCPMKLP